MNDREFDDLFNRVSNEAASTEERAEEQQDTGQEEQSQEPVEQEAEGSVEQTETPAHAEQDDAEEQEERAHIPPHVLRKVREDKKAEKARADKAEQEREELRRQLAELQNRPDEPQSRPDPLQDPDGYVERLKAELTAQMSTQLANERLALQIERAKEKHDPETVDAAIKWAAGRAIADRDFEKQADQQQNIAEWAIQQHRAQAIREQFERDPIAAARKIAEEQGWLKPSPATLTATVAPKKAATTPVVASLTDIPSSNGGAKVTVQDDTQEFNRIFDR